MKKYVKPDLCYENFQLSHTIASCSVPLNHGAETCKFDSSDLGGNAGDFTIFTEGENCEVGPDVYEDYCVYKSSDDYTIFNS